MMLARKDRLIYWPAPDLLPVTTLHYDINTNTNLIIVQRETNLIIADTNTNLIIVQTNTDIISTNTNLIIANTNTYQIIADTNTNWVIETPNGLLPIHIITWLIILVFEILANKAILKILEKKCQFKEATIPHA